MPTLSADAQGYVRRRCDACRREFAARLGPESGADWYWCPYCGSRQSWDRWFTPTQRAAIEDGLAEAALEIVSEQIDDALADLTSASDGILAFHASGHHYPTRQCPVEATNDLVERPAPCHLEVGLKLDPSWTTAPHCHLCGARASHVG